MNYQIPTFREVLNECIHAENFVINFNAECSAKIAFHQLPDLINNHTQLKGDEKINIDLFIDYAINFAYLPIISNTFGTAHFSFKLFKE